MALVYSDRVREVTSTTGLSDLTLGGAVDTFQPFSVIGNANTCYYTLEDGNRTDWEIGIGTYTSAGNVLTRDTVLQSSNADAKINLSANSHVVYLVIESTQWGGVHSDVNSATSTNTASTIVKRDASGNFNAGTISASLSGNASTATKWQTTRTINMTGDVTSDSVNIDGSGNITITNTTVADNSHLHDSVKGDNIGTLDFAPTAGTMFYDRYSSPATNASPGVINNANGVITLSTHTDTNYGHQLSFNDANGGLYTRRLAAGSWGTWGKIWNEFNDGASSGLDADLLDGQQGSYYLDWTNVTNKPDPVITVTLSGDVTGTANTTLTDLASGTISVATAVTNDSHTHDGRYYTETEADSRFYNVSGDTISGIMTVGTNEGANNNGFSYSNVKSFTLPAVGTRMAILNIGTSSSMRVVLTGSENGYFQTIILNITRNNTTDVDIVREGARSHVHSNDVYFSYDTSGNVYAEKSLTTARPLVIRKVEKFHGTYSILDGTLTGTAFGSDQSIIGVGTTNVGWNTVWHSGNDGAGSTLDADTVDGTQLSAITHSGDSVTLTGDVTGSATVASDGSISVATTIAANSVALGTDTTGSYVQQGATSGNGISGSVNSEAGTFTVTSNATSANTASTIVYRDASGNFSAGSITSSGLSVGNNGVVLTALGGALDSGQVAADGDLYLKIDANNDLTTNSLYVTHDAGAVLMRIQESGDVSFYEDTGVTAKFFWDASTERLGLGTAAPADGLHIANGAATDIGIRLDRNSTERANLQAVFDGAWLNGAQVVRLATGGTERARVDASGNLGVGVTAVSDKLHVANGSTAAAYARIANNEGYARIGADAGAMLLDVGGTERARIDASGNLLVGKTVNNDTGAGFRVNQNFISSVGDATPSAYFHRLTSDGEIVQFRKDGAIVGSIGTISGHLTLGNGGAGAIFTTSGIDTGSAFYPWNVSTNAGSDALVNLGGSTRRWKDLYLSGQVNASNAAFSGNTAVTMPVGTTAQRPTPTIGMLRFNSTDSKFEGYDGTQWKGVADGGLASVAVQTTAPSPIQGSMWLDSESGNLYIYYDDGTSAQWVQVGGLGITVSNNATLDDATALAIALG